MESLKIESTATTPAVFLDATQGLLELSGVSNEQDALGFYYPVIQWIDTYAAHPNEKTQLNIRLTVFNTASSKALFEIFKRVGGLEKKGHKVTINWYYKEGEDNLAEDIEYFNDLSSVPIHAVAE